MDDARWEPFQVAHLNDDATFRIENKSRQIAWSWLSAAEGIADAMLAGHDSIYVSINLEEAKEKIRYARRVYHSLRIGGLPKLVRDNELGLEFDNGARLSSLPARPPRGRARSNVYLDEFAHVRDDRRIYTAALPIISKGGRLRVGSSPLGASGVFWEVFGQAMQAYPGYTRKITPWWSIFAFCVDVRAALRAAPAMDTRERVDLFGNERIRAIYANMLLEDFQQEYEAAFVDETTAWITWEEIRRAQDAELNCRLVTARTGEQGVATDAIEWLRQEIAQQRAETVLLAGADIGRKRNTTELYLVGLSTVGSFPLRLGLTLDGMDFDDQMAVFVHALDRLPVAKLLVDSTGLGMQLAENLERAYPAKVEGQDFTNATKLLWATDAKMLIGQGKAPLPADRDLAYQIHSIKRQVTTSKNLIFDTDRNEKHHADKFWAWALALAARGDTTEPGDILTAFSFM